MSDIASRIKGIYHDKLGFYTFATLVLLIVFLFPSKGTVLANGSSGWQEAQPISPPTEHGVMATLTSDASGTLHVFWSSWAVNSETAEKRAILYANYRDGQWSEPIDVFLSPNGQDALYARTTVDAAGRLHLIWSAPEAQSFGPIYHSWVSIEQAAQVQEWQEPVVIASGTFQGDIALDADGNLHIVYASVLDGLGICHVLSMDNGDTWSAPTCLSRNYVLRDQEYEVRPRIAVDSENNLHVVFMIDDYSQLSTLAYTSRAVYYARFMTDSLTWSDAIVIDEVESRDPSYTGRQPDWGNVIVDLEDRIHIVWVGAPSMQRYHTWSKDGGLTWTPRETAIPQGGYNGWPGLAVDSDGTLHIACAGLNGVLGYNTWSLKQGMGTPVFIEGYGDPHNAQLEIALGNELHLVWNNYGGLPQGETPIQIFHTQLRTNAAPLEPQAIGEAPLVLKVDTSSSLPPRLTPTVTTPYLSELNNVPAAETAAEGDFTRVLFVSTLPVLCLIIPMVYWHARKRK